MSGNLAISALRADGHRVIAPALRRNAATRPLAILAIPCSTTGHDDFTPKPWEPAINLAVSVGVGQLVV